MGAKMPNPCPRDREKPPGSPAPPPRLRMHPAVKAFAAECRKQDNEFSSDTRTTLLVVDTRLLKAFLEATE